MIEFIPPNNTIISVPGEDSTYSANGNGNPMPVETFWGALWSRISQSLGIEPSDTKERSFEDLESGDVQHDFKKIDQTFDINKELHKRKSVSKNHKGLKYSALESQEDQEKSFNESKRSLDETTSDRENAAETIHLMSPENGIDAVDNSDFKDSKPTIEISEKELAKTNEQDKSGDSKNYKPSEVAPQLQEKQFRDNELTEIQAKDQNEAQQKETTPEIVYPVNSDKSQSKEASETQIAKLDREKRIQDAIVMLEQGISLIKVINLFIFKLNNSFVQTRNIV